MDYTHIKSLREAVLEELRQEFSPMPITVEHYKLAEIRLQTLLGIAVSDITAQVSASADMVRDQKK